MRHRRGSIAEAVRRLDERGVAIEDFHIGNVPARVKKLGDLWKPLLAARGRFRLEPLDGATIPYQLDGDYAGTLPAEAEVLPGQLRLLVSRDVARQIGVEVPGDQ